MIIRNLDSDGDWVFGQGVQDYLTDEAAIELNIRTRLLSFLNDCFWAMDFGVDWWNLLGSKNPTAQAAIIVQCRAVIAQSFGVVKINSVTASTDRTTRKATFKFNIDSIFSRNATGVVTL